MRMEPPEPPTPPEGPPKPLAIPPDFEPAPRKPPSAKAGDGAARRERAGSSITKISWEGPIPPPAAFDGYNDVVEDGAERLFAQFEAETKHRHLMQRRSQTLPFIVQIGSFVCALIFALSLLGVVVFAIIEKAYVTAGLMGGGIAVGIVSAFIRYGTPTKTKRTT